MVVREDRRDVDPNVWTPAHLQVIKAAALHPRVQTNPVDAATNRRCAGTPVTTAPGSAKCSRGGDTTSFPCAAILSVRRRRERAAGTTTGGPRLRQGTRSLVCRRDPLPQAADLPPSRNRRSKMADLPVPAATCCWRPRATSRRKIDVFEPLVNGTR